jgi:hypothetical protein
MSSQNSGSHIAARRGELMAELFLQELNPLFVSRPTEDFGYDLLVGFLNKKGGTNTFAVEVKSTDHQPGTRFQLPRRAFERFAHSNIPGLLLVVDVKQNRMYYAWLITTKAAGSINVSIPLTELNDVTKKELQMQFEAADSGVAAAG